MMALQQIDAEIGRFWPAATRATVALAVAAGAARDGANARARIVALCDELKALAGDDADGVLVGRIAGSLGDFVGRAALDVLALDVIAGHLEALRAVVRHTIGGEGGPVGRAIMAGLEASVAGHQPAA